MNFLLDFANSLKAENNDPDIIDPRKIAEKISEGKISTQHVGKATIEVLSQEVFSLANKDKAFRKQKWYGRANVVLSQISILKKENPARSRELSRMQNKLQSVISGQEI